MSRVLAGTAADLAGGRGSSVFGLLAEQSLLSFSKCNEQARGWHPPRPQQECRISD